MMKRIATILALVCLWAGSASAQHYVGIRGGYGNGSVRFYPPVETGALWGLYSGGVSWKYYSAERYMGGVEIDLLYIQKGYNEQYEYDKPDTIYSRKVNSIEMPICMQPHIYLRGRDIRLFLNLGLTINYNIDSSYELYSKRDGTISKGPYDMVLVRDNRWGYGLVGGFGVNYIMNRFEFMAEARFNFGYGDILKNHNKYPGNPQRSPLDNLYVHVGMYYRLGKGGILWEPNAKNKAKISEREARRIEKLGRKPPDEEPEETGGAAAKPEEKPAVETPSEPAETEPATIKPNEELQPAAPQQPVKEQKNGIDTPAQGSKTDTEGR